MIIERRKVIEMLKQMAKDEVIPADVQLIITERLIHNADELKPDEAAIREELGK